MEPEENQFVYKSVEKLNRYTASKAPNLIIKSLWLESIMHRLLNSITLVLKKLSLCKNKITCLKKKVPLYKNFNVFLFELNKV